MTNSFLRGAIAAEGYTLTSSWGTFQDEFYHHMGLGEPIGFSMRASLNATGGLIPFSAGTSLDNYWYFRRSVNGNTQRHQTVMGDPTLRMHVVAPPSNVAETAVSGGVQLNWAASPEPGVQTYAVYVAPTAAGPFTKVAASVSGTTYTHAGGSTGSVYMVRALKLETVPSGSYYNASQGAFSDEGGSMMLMASDTQTAAAPTGDGRGLKKKSAFSDQPITRSTLQVTDVDEQEDSLAALLA
jgi:hypothetical protein